MRSRAGIGPGAWRQVPVESAAQAVGAALARGLEADVAVDLPPGATKAQLMDAMKGRILAEGQLVGNYGR